MAKLIVSLDHCSPDEVKSIIAQISESCPEYSENILYKLNDMIALEGLSGIKALLAGTKARLMLDPKWHDIPNTLTNYIQKLSGS